MMLRRVCGTIFAMAGVALPLLAYVPEPQSVEAKGIWSVFSNPPREARPWCYYIWLNGHADRETITADRERKVRFRVPDWSRMVKVNGADARGPWHEVVVPKGESVWRLAFDMTPTVVSTYAQNTVFATDWFYGEAMSDWLVSVFESAHENPEMKGLSRTEGAAFVMRGPLLLARCTRAGGAAEEILKVGKTVNHGGFEATATPHQNANVWGAWTLTLKSGKDERKSEVSDYASSADTDDPDNAFSIWF